MGNYTALLCLFILVGSVNLLPIQDEGINVSAANRTKRQANRLHSIGCREFRNCSRSSSGGIFFPDDDSTSVIEDKFVPPIIKKVPECAKGRTFCETIDHYPSRYIANVLQESGVQFRGMFGKDVVDYSSLSHRIDVTDELPLCPSAENVVYPKVAKNKDDQWLFVVNEGDYKQGVRVETCNFSDTDNTQSCAFTEGFPLGYKTFCKQKYIYRKLIALDPAGKTTSDTFQLPSCCSCAVIKEGLRTRMRDYARSKNNNNTLEHSKR
uniref:Secreted Spaetzle-like protein n=1 Tax=Pristhesancus plagipennis TaxID=1955184 RepID=A0A2K8JP28_PRIPG|nr:secreted Spaetzle-like protein [Pristhesancus plagipennis]